MSTENEQNTDQTIAAEQQAQPLDLNDVILMANIINTVARRGAFEAKELSTVGALYEKIVALLPPEALNQPAQEETPQAETSNTSEEGDVPDNQLNFDFSGYAKEAEATTEG